MSALTGAPAADDVRSAGLGEAVQGHFERARGRQTGGPGAWIIGRWIALKHWLPKGQLLPEYVLRRRHRSIEILLWLHVPALFVFGVLMGNSVQHTAIDVSMVALCGLGASLERFRLKARIIAASFGSEPTCSAVLVDLWGGITEAHFHFFVMIGVLTLVSRTGRRSWSRSCSWSCITAWVGCWIPARCSATTRRRSSARGCGPASTVGSCSPPASPTSSRGAPTRTSCCAIRSPACPAGCST